MRLLLDLQPYPPTFPRHTRVHTQIHPDFAKNGIHGGLVQIVLRKHRVFLYVSAIFWVFYVRYAAQLIALPLF